ncbi:Glycosyltransferase, catalytic subunit of cellulose synthase and poly-beta-1,6-N-acetylglucosamine synthase [Streptomyces sp. Ag109_G2-15]|nr:Glycosyltransferase, catalytic subunit of cellulose synthase and poly-beta-1,6-N-acetylglucosamine synthase [Streptomyces sp. Ag109_G2-15]
MSNGSHLSPGGERWYEEAPPEQQRWGGEDALAYVDQAFGGWDHGSAQEQPYRPGAGTPYDSGAVPGGPYNSGVATAYGNPGVATPYGNPGVHEPSSFEGSTGPAAVPAPSRPHAAPVPLPRLRSARPHKPGFIRRGLDRQDPAIRHAARRVLTLVCLLPMLLILGREAPRLAQSPLVLGYGFTVLIGTIAMLYIAYSRYDDPSERPLRRRPRAKDLAAFPPLPTVPRVSFLLAVKDEEECIEDCVRSMAGSDYPDLQVVVVDDLSEDGTRDVLRRLEAELGITVIYLEKNVGKKHALVRACEVADGDVIAFTDSDCILAPDALARCVRALTTHPELGAVSGHARALNAADTFFTKAQDVWYEGQFRVAKAAESTFGSVTCVSGPLAVFRRDAIYNYLPAWAGDRFLGAPFRFATDRQLTGYVLGQRWRGKALKRRYADSPFVTAQDYPERAWRIGYVQSAKVWTNVPARFKPFMKQQIRWKKSFIRNLFFTGSFMWRRGPGPAALYYGHALWVVAAPVMAFRHLLWAPLHGAAFLTLLYLCGVILKGCVWGLAFKIDNPGDGRWRYRPLMSLLSALVLAWLLPYSFATIRRGVWARGAN